MTQPAESAFFTIGSDASCDLVLADETVAPLHAQLELTRDSVLILTDCGQAPATKLIHQGEARPVRRAVLRDGDHVQLGDIEISVHEMIEALNLQERCGVLDGAADGASGGDADHASDDDADRSVEDVGDDRDPNRNRNRGLDRGHDPDHPLNPNRNRQAEHRSEDVDRNAAADADVDVAPAPHRQAANALVLPCARCGKLTDSLKRNRLARYFVFAWLFWWGQFADYTACASCMRVILVQRALINLPGANIAWPVIVLVNGWHFLWSFQKGHNKRVKVLLPPDLVQR